MDGNRIYREYKTVKLVNPRECQSKTPMEIIDPRWLGSGHFEWELELAQSLLDAVGTAIQNEQEEADITSLFTCDLSAWTTFGKMWFKQKDIHKHILPSFHVISENEEEIKLEYII